MNIGTDIICVDDLPNYDLTAPSRFFIDNFTREEIEYAVSKKNIKNVFAIIFSIKESLIKCDNSLINLNFNQINIKYSNDIPSYRDFIISFSSSEKYIITIVYHL